MTFGDFVERVVETPICCELKQHLDKLHESYIKDPKNVCFISQEDQQKAICLCFYHYY